MARGFILGLFWGLVIAGIMVIVASELAVRQSIARGPEAGAVDLPAGSGFDAVRSDLPPEAPGATAETPRRDVPPPPEPGAEPGAEPTATLPEVDGPRTPEAGSDPAAAEPDAPAESPAPDAPAGMGDTRPGARTAPAIVPSAPDSIPQTEGQPAPPRGDPPTVAAEPEAPAVPGSGAGADLTIGGADLPPEAPASGDALAPSAPDGPVDPPDAALPGVDSGAAQAQLDGPPFEEVPPAAPEPDEDEAAAASRPSGMASGSAPDSAPLPPAATTRPALSDEIAGIAGPAVPDEEALQAPAPDAMAAVPELPERTETAPEAGQAVVPEPGPGPTTEIMNPGQAAASRVETGRLPQVGGADDAEEPAAASPETQEPPGETAALRRNAAEFEVPPDRPLMSVVLLDGGDLPTDLPFPATLALLPTNPEAMLRAQVYRAAGHEIAVIPALPEGATAGDVAQALEGSRALLDQAVALMDSPEGTLQVSRDALEQVVNTAARTGHGVLTFPRGLNAAARVAEREGVIAGTVFRDIDGAGQDSAAVRRFLDQAAFRARQEGAVIVFARVRPETVAGLAEWVLGSRAESVTMAPLSAVLLALEGVPEE